MRYRTYHSASLEMIPGRFDKIRARIKTPVLILVGYIIVKFTGTAIIEIIIFIDYPSTFTEQMNELVLIVGRPIATVPTFAILLHLSISAAIFIGFVLMPRKYNLEPVDAETLRFMLDPLREVRRIDEVIKEILEEYVTALSRNSMNRIRKKKESLGVELACGYDVFSADKRESITRQVINHHLRRLHLMRPPIYDTVWYKKMYVNFSVFAALCTSALFTTLLVPYLIFMWDKQRRCGTDLHCPIEKVYPIQDLIACAELVLGLVLADFSIGIQLCVIGSTMVTQVYLIKGVKKSLSECLNTTAEYFNTLDTCDQIEEIPRIKRSRSHDFALSSSVNNPEDASRARRFRLESALLTTLVQLIASLKDWRRFSQLCGEFIEFYLFGMLLYLVSLLVVDRLNPHELLVLRTSAIAAVWLLMDCVLLGCAYVFSQVIELEKIAWSILAQLGSNYHMVLEDGSAGLAEAGIGPTDLMSKKWRILVYGYSMSDVENSIMPFGVSLTYEKVLQLNFYIISLALLLRQYA